MAISILGRDEQIGVLGVPGRAPGSLLGENFDLPNGSPAFVWDGPVSAYVWPTEAITHVSSSDDTDTGDVLVSGASYPDWDNVDEVVTLQGYTSVALPTSLARFNSARSLSNLGGDVYFHPDAATTNGVPNNLDLVKGFIDSAKNVSKHGAYSVPYGYKIVLKQFILSAFLGATGNLQVFVCSRDFKVPFNGTMYRDQTLAFSEGESSVLNFPIDDVSFLGGHEIWFEALASNNNFGIAIAVPFEKVKI